NQSTSQPTPGSYAVADTGLPGNFNNGANGITISQLTFQTPATAPGELVGFGIIPVPLDLTGSSIQLVAYTARVGNLKITLDSPLVSSLTPTITPGEWAWAGLGNVTISGQIQPVVDIPSQPTVVLGTFPFSQATLMPLAGTFSGDGTGSEVTLGIPLGALQ